MATEHCPECGEAIRPRATSCPCGWQATPTKVAGSTDHNRCTFVIGDRRCRYAAAIYEGQTRGVQHGVCSGHFRPTPHSALETLLQSERDAPTPDHSSAAQLTETLRRYEADKGRYALSEIEQQVHREIPRSADGLGDWWAHRILRLHELGFRLPPASISIARQVVKPQPGTPVDLEATSERAAIQAA